MSVKPDEAVIVNSATPGVEVISMYAAPRDSTALFNTKSETFSKAGS